MTGEPDPPHAVPSVDEPRSDRSPDPESLAYDDFLREVDRLAASRQATNRRERDARILGLVTLGVAIAALLIALVALALTVVRA